MNIIRLISAFLIVVALTGCARTVTTIGIVGNQFTLEVRFKGDIDPGTNRYTVIFGAVAPQSPTPPDYFIAPGEAVDTNRFKTAQNLDYYYQNYFSTWQDFIALESGNFFTLTKGPFTNSASHEAFLGSREFLQTRIVQTAADAKRMRFTIFFSRLSAQPASLFFNVMAVDNTGNLQDRLDFLDTSFPTTQGTILSGTEIEGDAPAALDITGWSVEVQ